MNEAIWDAFVIKNPWAIKIRDSLTQAVEMLEEGFRQGRRLFLAGNGGSYADCLHFSGELLKSFESFRSLSQTMPSQWQQSWAAPYLQKIQPAFRVWVLGTNPALQTALLNDIQEPALYFAQELYLLAQPGDMLGLFSTSGNSTNILVVAELANLMEMKTLALTGWQENKLEKIAQITIKAPVKGSAAIIQEYHLPIYHLISRLLENSLYPS